MRILTTLTFYALLSTLFSQNGIIRGTVSDAQSGETLIGVSVKSESGGVASDANGQFQLSLPPGRQSLVFSYVGYEPKTESFTIVAGQTLTLNVQLGDSPNLLQTATVTSGKFEKPLGQVTVSLDVLKPELLKSINATAIDGALQKIPGVAIVDGQAQIRGGSGFSYGAGTRVLLLVDDMPALQPDAGFPNWSDYPIENITQTEVLKGAASALYGSSAMNGIINIRTGYAKDKPETEAAVFGTVHGTPKDERMAWWKADTSSLAIPYEFGFNAVHRRKEGKFDIVIGTFGSKHESFKAKTYGERIRLTPNFRYRVNDKLTLGLNSNFNAGRSGSFFIWANDTTGAYLPGLNSESFTRGRLRFMIDPSATYFDGFGNKHKFLGRYFYIHNNNSGNQSNDSRNYYGEYQFQRNFENVGLVLTSGVVGQKSTIDAELYNGNFDSENIAGYLQLDYQPVKRLNLSAGLRYERNVQLSPDTVRYFETELDTIPNGRTQDAQPVVRFGANYQIGPVTYVRASYGQGYRYPTLAEKFINTDFGVGNQVTPNPILGPESGWTAEIGIKHAFQIQNWKAFADLTSFKSEYEQMMEFVLAKLTAKIINGQFVPVAYFQSQNVGNTVVTGGEFSITGLGKIGPGTLRLLAGFTKIDPKFKNFDPARDTSSSSANYNVLKYRFRNQFKWDSEYTWSRFSFGLSCQFNSHVEAIDRIFQQDETVQPPFAVPPFQAVKRFRREHDNGFYLWDLRASFQATKQLKVAFLVNNFTNTVYTYRPALLEAPRSFTLRAEVKL